jgi:hypothetical protein
VILKLRVAGRRTAGAPIARAIAREQLPFEA